MLPILQFCKFTLFGLVAGDFVQRDQSADVPIRGQILGEKNLGQLRDCAIEDGFENLGLIISGLEGRL